MARKPSEDLRQLFEASKKQPTKTSAYETADRAAASIIWMQGYLRRVEEALAENDTQTFVNVRQERAFAKEELARLHQVHNEINEWISKDSN